MRGQKRGVLTVLPLPPALAAAAVATAAAVCAALTVSSWWWAAAAPPLLLLLTALHDVLQRRHSILRNHPVLGHLRFALEALRPEIQQYFVERNFDGRPFDRDTRSLVYERAKGTDAEEPFGSERDLHEAGSEYLTPSMAPRPLPTGTPRVRVGGPDCTQPYDMALRNTCPVGVATQSERRARALDVGDKAQRVRRYQEATVRSAREIMAAMGIDDARALRPRMLLQRVDPHTVRSYAELHEWLSPGQLLASPPESWAADWSAADPDRFTR